MAIGDVKAIDAVLNVHVLDTFMKYRSTWHTTFLGQKIHASSDAMEGMTIEQLLAKMDRVGIERALLIATKAGPAGMPTSFRVPIEAVAELVRQHPDRFWGLAGVDPTEGMKGIRELEYAVKELGFVGAHLYPHWFEMAPDHARYYPIYAKCVELDIPIQMQVGHCLRYSADRPLKSVGRPVTLDTIACDFPDLKLVGIHIGWPWTEEMISVAWKHPNVYIGCDAYAPKHWPKEFVHFINSWGQDKVVFGTDYPVIDLERAIKEIEELGLRPAAKQKLLRDNVVRLYKLNV